MSLRQGIAGGLDNVATTRFERKFERRYCQTFSTGFSSGERDGRKTRVMFFGIMSVPSGAIEQQDGVQIVTCSPFFRPV
ncbi:hypothetical protein [Xanthobacter sediminis]